MKKQVLEPLPNTNNPLCDVSSTGREKPWREKKQANELLSLAYREIDQKKAMRLWECGRFLMFRRYGDGSKKLDGMTSCRVRLCPICAWRRSLKVFHSMRRIVEYCHENHPDYAYLFLTLTVKNCDADSLSQTLTDMLSAWNAFTKITAIKDVVQGWYRGLEITHNVNPNSESYDTYHPHFHALIAVKKSYFGLKYLSQEEWTSFWKQALKCDYTPVVDVRRVKGNDMKAIAECAKYSVKDVDYIIPEDWPLTVKTVAVLDQALHRRRFVAFGGEFKRVKQLLKLEDEETGSLIDVGGEDESPKDEDYILETYMWYSGYRQYFRVDS